jgi:hypothetical protein
VRIDVTIGYYVPQGNVGLTSCAPTAGRSGDCTDEGFTIRAAASGCIAVDHYADGSSIPGNCSIGYPGDPNLPGDGTVTVNYPTLPIPGYVTGCTQFRIQPATDTVAHIEFIDGAGIAWTVDGLEWDARGGAPAPGGKTDWPSNTVMVHATSGNSQVELTLSGDLNGIGSCSGGQQMQSLQFILQGSGRVGPA